MTRQEFIDDVTTWGELLNFCANEDCDLCEDIVDPGYVDEYVNDSLVDWACNNDWRSLLGILNNVDDNSGYDYYRYDDYEYVPVDDDRDLFEEYKDSVLEWMDDNDYWPDGDEDEEEEPAHGRLLIPLLSPPRNRRILIRFRMRTAPSQTCLPQASDASLPSTRRRSARRRKRTGFSRNFHSSGGKSWISVNAMTSFSRIP